jgi:hypothetical protein
MPPKPKPKKAAPEPEPEPVFDPHAPLPPQLQAFVDDAGTEMCAQLAGEIVDKSFAQAYASELDGRSGPQEVDYEMVQIVRTMRWYFIANDKGSDLRAPSWAPDKEPVPAMRDAWSRGTCQGRPKKAPSRPASAAYILSSSSSYSGNRIRPGSAGGDRSRRSPSRPGSAASAPGGLRSAKSTPALSKGSSVGSTGSLMEEVVGPGGKIIVTARAPPRPPEPLLTAAEKKVAKDALTCSL